MSETTERDPTLGRRPFTIGLLVGAFLAVAPGGALAVSLEEALTAAYLRNPTLRAARAQLRTVNEQVPQELSNWRPNVTVNGSGGTQYIDTSGRNSDTSNPWDAELVVSQPLYRGGRTLSGTSRAENEIRAERLRLTSTEQQTLLASVTAYMDVWRDEAILRLNINNEQVLARQLEASQDRFAVGEITRTDVAQSEARLANATADRILSEGRLAASRAVFREIVGLEPVNIQRPDRIAGVPESSEDVVALARGTNPDILSAEFAERAARDDVRVRIGELLPTVTVEGRLLRSENQISRTSQTTQAEIRAQVSVPLYQSGFVFSRIREAKQVSSQRRLEIDEARRRAEQEAITAWEQFETARAQIISFQSQVRSNEIALEGVRQENAVGARTVLDILDAEQELLDSQVSLVGAERDQIVADYAILAAIGRLTASDIALPVQIYDADSDYEVVRDKWFGTGTPVE